MGLVELRPDSAAVTARPRPGAWRGSVRERPGRAGGGSPWWVLVAIGVVAASVLVAAMGTTVVSGDGVWHLIWGRALAGGSLETFATGPTPHPSLLVLGAATSALGNDASYLVSYVLFGPVAFGALIASIFDVARRLSSSWAALAAILMVATSTGVVLIAGAARYDIAFAALVMAAVALEMARPRRGVAPLVCLAVAGVVRPEAWALAGLYWLWLAPPLSWPARLRTGMLVAVAPALWSAMDWLVMGDALYSLHATDEASAVLYGQYTPWENLEAAGRNMIWYLGVWPLLLLPAAAVVLLRDRPRPALAPLGALAVTLGVFLLYLAQGMASSERYLLVPICVLAVLAAVAIDGGGRRTRARVGFGIFAAVILAVQLAGRADVYDAVEARSAAAHTRHETARALVEQPGVREALVSCPRVSLPTGKMRHWFAFHSGRAPAAFVSDSKGRTHPDLYIAPGNPAVAKMALTRPRFDDDISYRVPPGLTAVRRNEDWILYASPDSACASGLR